MEKKKVKTINSFQQSPEEKKENEVAMKEYKLYCWLPESVCPVGDRNIYFDDLEDIKDLPNYMVKYIMENFRETEREL